MFTQIEKKPIHYFTRSSEFTNAGGGGLRRTKQIMELLEEEWDVEFNSSRNKIVQNGFYNKLNLMYLNMISDNRFWDKTQRKSFYYLRSVAKAWRKKSSDLKNLVVIEDPIYFKPFVDEVMKLEIPTIAFCQNIESMCYSHGSFDNYLKSFKNELEILKKFKLVVTISREESVLLENFGIRTFYLPYFPPKSIVKRLKKIRINRQKNTKKNIILLGNAGNINTRNGMKEIIDYWSKSKLSSKYNKLLIAGYKTEKYFNNLGSNNVIEFLGPLSEDLLDKTLANVQACLCYQKKGGGALTRITEMLLAGIPVVANSFAARSYYQNKGIIEFPFLDDLEQAINVLEENEIVPDIKKPIAIKLIERIKNLYGI